MSREYPTAPVTGVGAVVIDSGRVLLVRRGREPLKGQWSVPGGAVELGETLEGAVVREVVEETRLKVVPVSILKPVDRIEFDAKGHIRFHYVLIDFLCHVDQVEKGNRMPVACSDVLEAVWAPVAGLRDSKEFLITSWTLDVIEEGWRRAQLRPEIFDKKERTLRNDLT